jgi:hypothetical protein
MVHVKNEDSLYCKNSRYFRELLFWFRNNTSWWNENQTSKNIKCFNYSIYKFCLFCQKKNLLERLWLETETDWFMINLHCLRSYWWDIISCMFSQNWLKIMCKNTPKTTLNAWQERRSRYWQAYGRYIQNTLICSIWAYKQEIFNSDGMRLFTEELFGKMEKVLWLKKSN